MSTAARDHDLPPRWDGSPVEWGPWRQVWSSFEFHARPEDVACTACGVIETPAHAAGRIDGRLALLALRCACGRDRVVDARTDEMWDLEPSDYGDEGSTPPAAPMDAPTLFDAEPYTRPDPLTGRGEDARRTARQIAALAAGIHPLGGRVHDAAPPVGDRQAPGPRCGACARATSDGHHARAYLKCALRITRGAATDLRAWWPACASFTPKETP